MRGCLKKPGPGDVARTSSTRTAMSGESTTSSTPVTVTSTPRRSTASASADIVQSSLAAVPGGDVGHGGDDIVHVAVGHRGIERQAHDPTPGLFRPGKLSGPVAPHVLVVGVEVQRDEVHARSHVAGAELVDEAVAVDPQSTGAQADHVEVPGVRPVPRRVRRALDGIDLRGGAVVARREPAAPGVESGELAELREAEARRQVGQIVLVAVGEDLVAPVAGRRVALPGVTADAVQGENARLLRE